MPRNWLPLAIMAILLSAFAIGACSSDSSATSKPKVVATTVQVGALTKAVGGDAIDLKTLVGAGVDPHDYEASANDIKAVGDAVLILRNGIGLDAFLDKAIKGSGAKNVITVTEGVPLRKGDNQSSSSEDDPHVWQNPLNDKIMVDNIARALAGAIPDSAAVFAANAAAYNKRLDSVDTEIQQLVSTLPPANRKMVTDHDAFGYFIARYGLQFVGTVIPGTTSGSESSAKDIAALEDTIRRENVKAIFAETSIDPKVSRQIAKDTNVKIVDTLYGDSLGKPGSGADTVDGMLLANAHTIVDALK
jgi:zinc/manganese transport system substrate-binding protein/manganese/iron transport system substrate-binding protein